ncbi:MAG: NAD-dependent epimerase/dehydratase family protein [Desulfobacterales bacterium]|nr:NAD-dependent epimerase/dehydratase family protein [Desulfobacterales bacterium]
MSTILVTGGCGFIGSHIVGELVDRGDTTVVVDDLSMGTRDNLNPNAVFYHGDIADRDFLRKVFEQHSFDVVIHQAAKINTSVLTEQPLVDVWTSVVGTINLIELCLEHNVARLVYASSVAVYGRVETLPVSENVTPRPIYSYSIAKLCAEQYLEFYAKTHGLKYHALRYANVYGPRQPIYGEVGVIAIFTERVVNGQELNIYGDGEHIRDYIYVQNVVEATLRSLEVEGNLVLNVGCGVPVTVNRLFEILQSCSGRMLEVAYKPERVGELGKFYCDISRLKAHLHWRPKISLEEGIFKTVQYYERKRDHGS